MSNMFINISFKLIFKDELRKLLEEERKNASMKFESIKKEHSDKELIWKEALEAVVHEKDLKLESALGEIDKLKSEVKLTSTLEESYAGQLDSAK